MSERAKSEFVQQSNVEGVRSIATSVALMVSEARRSSTSTKPEERKAESPEDFKGDLTHILDYKGGVDPEDNARLVISLESASRKPIEVTYQRRADGVYLGLVPTSGILPPDTEIVTIKKITNRTSSGGFVVQFGDIPASGNPNPDIEIDYKDFILFFCAQYESKMTSGVPEEQTKVIQETFAHLRGAGGVLPDAIRVETASSATPTIKKFDKQSAVAQSLADKEKTRVTQRQAEIRSSLAAEKEVEVVDAAGIKTMSKVAKTPEEIEKEIKTQLDTEEKSNPPTPEAALVTRLTTENVQTPEDLAMAFQFMSESQIDKKIQELEAKYGNAESELVQAQERATRSQDAQMAKGFQDEAKKWYKIRAETIGNIEKWKKFKEQRHLIVDRFFAKTQAGELSQEVIENVHKAMTEGNVDKVVEEMAKNSGVELTPEAIDGLNTSEKQKEILKFLIEIGGPFLIIALEMILREFKLFGAN